MKTKRYTLVRAVLLLLFLAYYGATTVFVHTHSDLRGAITHSHPYKSSSSHQHSDSSYQLINHLSHCVLLVGATVCVAAFFFRLAVFLDPKVSVRNFVLSFFPPLRGPPAIGVF